MALPIYLFLFTLIVTCLGIRKHQFVATRLSIVSLSNNRSLHTGAVVRGAGIAVAFSCLLAIVAVYFSKNITVSGFYTLIIGSSLAALVGFLDDIFDLGQLLRLVIQLALASLVVCYGFIQLNNNLPLSASLFILIVIVVCWFYNLYNFIDGIDGFAGLVAVLMVGAAGVLSVVGGYQSDLMLCSILLASVMGFLVFNLPPAKVFMGDSGTWFISFYLSFLAIDTVTKGHLPLGFWLILSAYCVSDATVTLIVRFFTTSNWYRAHRSHAYQNITIIWGSHKKALVFLMSIHVFWLLPLALLTYIYPALQIFLVLVAYAPICIFSLQFGPRFQST